MTQLRVRIFSVYKMGCNSNRDAVNMEELNLTNCEKYLNYHAQPVDKIDLVTRKISRNNQLAN